jgi:hypothetical protein
MNSERLVKGIHKWKPLGTWSAGRPKNRWGDDVKKNLKLLKIWNWTKCFQNRKKWRRIVEKSRTFEVVPEEVVVVWSSRERTWHRVNKRHVLDTSTRMGFVQIVWCQYRAHWQTASVV